MESEVAALTSSAERLAKCGGILTARGRAGADLLDLRMADPPSGHQKNSADSAVSEDLRAWVYPYHQLAAPLKTAQGLHELLTESSDTDMAKELDDMTNLWIGYRCVRSQTS